MYRYYNFGFQFVCNNYVNGHFLSTDCCEMLTQLFSHQTSQLSVENIFLQGLQMSDTKLYVSSAK